MAIQKSDFAAGFSDPTRLLVAEEGAVVPEPAERGRLLRREETGMNLSSVCNSVTMRGTWGGLLEGLVREGGAVEEVEAATLRADIRRLAYSSCALGLQKSRSSGGTRPFTRADLLRIPGRPG